MARKKQLERPCEESYWLDLPSAERVARDLETLLVGDKLEVSAARRTLILELLQRGIAQPSTASSFDSESPQPMRPRKKRPEKGISPDENEQQHPHTTEHNDEPEGKEWPWGEGARLGPIHLGLAFPEDALADGCTRLAIVHDIIVRDQGWPFEPLLNCALRDQLSPARAADFCQTATAESCVFDVQGYDRQSIELAVEAVRAHLAKAMPVLPPRAGSDQQLTSNGTPTRMTTGMSKQARALAVKTEHPDWTDIQVAQAAGCHVKSLYRWELFKMSKAILKEGKANLLKGNKPKEEPMDAWEDKDRDEAS